MSHLDEPELDDYDEEQYGREKADYDGHLPDDEPEDEPEEQA